MTSSPLTLLEILSSDPRMRGHQHGETLRDQIREIAEIRLERTCALSGFKRVKEVLDLAEQHVPILKAFDEDLFLEFKAIAESSNLSLARLVVLNHYTDLRDIAPESLGTHKDDNGGCSIIFSPAKSGPILGQTWDIHGSAEPYVILLKVNNSLVFSIAGCLGMTGLNHYGVGIAINNLVSIDAKVGIIWPALIRKALTHKTAIDAKDEIMAALLGSGRNFAVADKANFFGIEASPSKKKIVIDKPSLYFHTNHCLDEEMRKTHVVNKESTTYWRYQQLDEVVRHQPLDSAQEVFLALSHVSLAKSVKEPHKTATCGALVMDINKGYVVGCQGSPNQELLQLAQTTVSL